MSLITDIVFKAAIMSDSEIRAIVTPSATSYQSHPKPRIYNTAIPVPDEDLDNVPVPYIIIIPKNGNNDTGTKDDYEGDTDTVNVEVLAATSTRGQLGKLMTMIRNAVRDFFVNYAPPEDDDAEDLSEEIPLDYQVGWSDVFYDSYKPCYYQSLYYQCDTNRTAK